jgi:hypothetical protein
MDVPVRQPVTHPMPEIAAFVTKMKAAFGERVIDEAIRRGKAGEATFTRRKTSARLVRPDPLELTSGTLTVQCATGTIAPAATARV